MKPSTVFLGEMTNPEVEAFLDAHHTVIIPTGSTEQHGPHGPLLTDVLIPQEVARRVAPQIGAVVAPPINFTSPGSVYRATKSGTWGDARKSSPEMGERYLQAGVRSTLAVLENIEKTFAAMPPR